MSNHNGNNCTTCVACFNNCSTCPKHTCEVDQMNLNNMARVNKQVRMDSSRYMMMRRSGTVSKQVGQSAQKRNLGQAGGPGDAVHAIQKNCRGSSKYPNEWKKVTYRVPTVKARTAYRGQSGVDKKHGSYARFLARRVGGVLRKEKMPGIIAKTAIIKQPRNRTGTNSGARAESRISTKVNYCLSDNARGPQGFRLLPRNAPSFSAYSGFRDKVTTYNKTRNPYDPRREICPTSEIGISTCFSTKCCDNRIGFSCTKVMVPQLQPNTGANLTFIGYDAVYPIGSISNNSLGNGLSILWLGWQTGNFTPTLNNTFYIAIKGLSNENRTNYPFCSITIHTSNGLLTLKANESRGNYDGVSSTEWNAATDSIYIWDLTTNPFTSGTPVNIRFDLDKINCDEKRTDCGHGGKARCGCCVKTSFKNGKQQFV